MIALGDNEGMILYGEAPRFQDARQKGAEWLAKLRVKVDRGFVIPPFFMGFIDGRFHLEPTEGRFRFFLVENKGLVFIAE
ncbi:MAG: hypothetical protein P8018_05310 [Acidobacteriota bacterium]